MAVDYPSNSYRNKEEEPVSEKPVIREGSARKKSEFLKIVDFVLSDDRIEPPEFIEKATRIVRRASRLVGIVDEILEPNRRRYSGSSSASRVPYHGYYDDRYRDRDDQVERRPVSHVYDELDYDNARDAEDVLLSMKDTIREYGIVTVANYYEFSRVRADNIQDTKYGWTNLNNVGIHRTWNGRWVIDLSRPMPIDERR